MTGLSRRGLLKATAHILGGGLAAATLGGGYSYLLEPDWLQVETVRVPLAGLASNLRSFRIVQFSDTHFGPYFGEAEGAQTVARVNRLQPHLIVFSGDLVTQLIEGELDLARTMLRELRAPLGTFAVLGNHDHWTDSESVANALEAGGVVLLRNENRLIEWNGGRFWLAGVDDVWEQHHDLAAALEGVDGETPVILLAHEPDYADEVAADGRVSLQLSGHSHGGQIRIPGYGAPVLPYLGRKYPVGLRRLRKMWLYTNRGVGLLAPPVRLNCRPEITQIVLEPAQ